MYVSKLPLEGVRYPERLHYIITKPATDQIDSTVNNSIRTFARRSSGFFLENMGDLRHYLAFSGKLFSSVHLFKVLDIRKKDCIAKFN